MATVNKRNKVMVSVIAIILAILMIFGLVVSVIPYVLADEYVPDNTAETAEYITAERAKAN